MSRPLLRPAMLILLIIASLLQWGCSSPGRSYANTGMQETLETEILLNDSKMFVYRLKWPDGAIPNHIRVAHHSGQGQTRDAGGVDINRHTYQRLQQNAAYVVQNMAYCRDGFIELDRSISRYHLWLKGECKEGANDADRQTFGAQKILPVRQDI